MQEVMERKPDGIPLVDHGVIASDAIAYLSGVNYGSVVKVLAAAAAVDEFLYVESDGEDESDILDMRGVPTTAPQPGNPAHSRRLAVTDTFVRKVVASGIASKYRDLLDKLPRFAAFSPGRKERK